MVPGEAAETQETETQEPAAAVVEVPRPESDDEGGGEPAQKNGSGIRDEKKHARAMGLREIRENAERQNAELRDQLRQHTEALAEVRGRLAERDSARQTQVTDPAAELDAKVAKLTAEADAALAIASADGTAPAIARAQLNRYNEINRQISREISRHETQQQLSEFVRSMPQGQHQEQVAQFTLETEFPWMQSHGNALEWAKGAERQLIAEGRPASIATSREALAAAAVKFNLGGQPLPRSASHNDRRYAGTPTTRGDDSDGPTHVALSQQDMQAVRAYAATRGISLDEAKRKVAKMLTEK